jgi:hypothetical protein
MIIGLVVASTRTVFYARTLDLLPANYAKPWSVVAGSLAFIFPGLPPLSALTATKDVFTVWEPGSTVFTLSIVFPFLDMFSQSASCLFVNFTFHNLAWFKPYLVFRLDYNRLPCPGVNAHSLFRYYSLQDANVWQKDAPVANGKHRIKQGYYSVKVHLRFAQVLLG